MFQHFICLIKGAFCGEKNLNVIKMHGTAIQKLTTIHFYAQHYETTSCLINRFSYNQSLSISGNSTSSKKIDMFCFLCLSCKQISLRIKSEGRSSHRLPIRFLVFWHVTLCPCVNSVWRLERHVFSFSPKDTGSHPRRLKSVQVNTFWRLAQCVNHADCVAVIVIQT
jgi:hypothetical protein